MQKHIRTGLLMTIAISLHIVFILKLFIEHNIISSLIVLFIFFIIFHFLYLDIYTKDSKKTLLVIAIITLIETSILWLLGNESMIQSLIIINGTIIFLGKNLEAIANESVYFKSINYFFDGTHVFTFGIAIAYSLFTMNIYNNFPFSCNELSKGGSIVLEKITKPLNISRGQNSGHTQIINQTKIKDLLSVGKIVNIESDIKIESIEKFKIWKNELITKTLTENNELNQGICEFSLNKLNMQFKNPGFQTSVIVLMVGIIYPFLKIIIYILSIIGRLLFKILKKAKIYKITKIINEIEKIG